jgi:hypothetical protein
MSGIPFAPLVPASFIFASAYVMIMNAENKLFANDIWSGKSAAEIISRHDVEVKMTYWVGLILVLLMIYAVSFIKYFWHLGVRKFTDKIRKDGQISDPAPVQFFIYHTSGVASWFGILWLAFAITNMFFPGHPFTTIDKFFKENVLWGAAFGAVVLLFFVKYYESNTQILSEIYRNKELVSKVRAASLIIPFGLFVCLVMAGMLSAFWLFHKASMITAH